MALEIFSEIGRTNAAKGSAAVFVYLPHRPDLGRRRTELERFRARFTLQMKRRSLPFIDLTPSILSLAEADRGALFIQAGGKFRHAKGHYSAEGNAFVARRLAEHLIPHLAVRSP